MTIKLYATASEQNRLDKLLLTIQELNGTLKSATDILNPVILIEGNYETVLKSANYAYIQEFGRYYFITDIRIIRTDLVELSMHIDVLSTYKDQIRKNMALIRRQENEWNLRIPDNQIQVEQHPIITTQKFPQAFNQAQFELIVSSN